MMMLFLLVMIVVMFVVFWTIIRHAPPPELLRETTIDWEAAADERVQEFIAQGKIVYAIALYRGLTDVDEKTAREIIEFLAANPDFLKAKKRKGFYDSANAGLRDLVEAGRIDEAVETYRKFAGVDEYTARDAIAELERESHLKDHS